MTESTILRQAEFDPKVKTYWIVGPFIVLSLFIVTIPLAKIFIQRYLDNMSCELTNRTLNIKKGIWNKTESTIPLEKITDLQLFQGPLMRHFGLHGFKVETAGQSSPTGGSLVNIVGIIDTKGFRQAVLDQRDQTATGATPIAPIPAPAAVSSDQTTELLTDIRNALHRIEQGLAEQ